MTDLKAYIRDVPDFPKPGIMFRDISPLLREHFATAIQEMERLFTQEEWNNIDYVAGIESRGFILAAGLAARRHKGFIKIRKPGKLPGPKEKVDYGLEYGTDSLEMQYGKGRVLIADDVLATGGTLAAAAELTEKTGHSVVGFALLINLAYLNSFEWKGQKARTVVEYKEGA
ncbi:MAG: adenine phosphoribosyltransferase [Alphaproteobacteria bacterium]|nr:adenine phosphoribosyltransferase [Alphaproteobacteria bacterium]